MPPPIELARWTIILLVCAVLAIAGASDVRDRRIPNWTVLAIAALFGAWWFVEPSVSLISSLGAALVMFIISCALYALRIVGAGDSKLATVVALFAGLSRLPQFAIYMSLAGGVLVLCMMALEPTRVLVMLQMRAKGRADRGVPYGVAIGAAGAMLLLMPAPRLSF